MVFKGKETYDTSQEGITKVENEAIKLHWRSITSVLDDLNCL